METTNSSPFTQPQQAPQQQATQGHIYTAKLPSKGLCYSLTHPLCNCEEVELREMTPLDEDLLTSTALLKNGTAIDRLMFSLFCNKMIDPGTLLTGDRNAILLAIRVANFGAEYEVDQVYCPVCGEKFPYTFDLSNMQMKTLDATPVRPNENLFSFKLPKSGVEVHFSLPTGADQQELSKTKENRKKKLNTQIENNVSAGLMSQLKEVISGANKNISDFITKELKSFDSRALRTYMESINPDIIMKKEITCPMGDCGEVSEVPVPLALSFLFLIG